MAHLESKIFFCLTGFTGVTAIVSDRVYPKRLKQGCKLPAISFERVSGNFDNDLEGYSGLEQPRVMINCWALGYVQAKDLAKAVRAAMLAATAFKATILTDSDLSEDAANYYGVSLDFSVWHEED